MSRNALPSGDWRLDPFSKIQRFVPAPINEISTRGRKLKPCGTVAAYRRHLYRGEDACDECLEACRLDRASYRRDLAKRRNQ